MNQSGKNRSSDQTSEEERNFEPEVCAHLGSKRCGRRAPNTGILQEGKEEAEYGRQRTGPTAQHCHGTGDAAVEGLWLTVRGWTITRGGVGTVLLWTSSPRGEATLSWRKPHDRRTRYSQGTFATSNSFWKGPWGTKNPLGVEPIGQHQHGGEAAQQAGHAGQG